MFTIPYISRKRPSQYKGRMDRQRRRILRNWQKIAWDGWWGDSLDVRFELARRMAVYAGKKVLDIGCGPGILTAELSPSNRSVGLDLSLDRLKHAANLASWGMFVCADFEKLPFKKASFDVIILGGVIELISDRKGYLVDLKTLGRPGSSMLATTPNGDYWVYKRHPSLLKLAEVQDVFSGHSNVDIFGYNPTPPLLPQKILAVIPGKFLPYVGVPTAALARIPGIKFILRQLMRVSSLRRHSKWFLIRAK